MPATPSRPSNLPPALKSIIDTILPPDDPFGGLSPVGMGGTAVNAIRRTSHPAMEAILKMLGGSPTPRNPVKVLAGERISSRVPPARSLSIPEGFKLPDGPSEFPRRSPLMQELYARQRVFDAHNRPTHTKTFLQSMKDHTAPRATSLEDLLTTAQTSAPRQAPPLSGKFHRGAHKR